MPLGYPFFTDDKDLYANLAEPALPPELPAAPASPAAPSFSSTSIFQDPEFLKLQSQFPQETEDDIVRRRNLRESALNSAFFDDLSSIALGKAPSAESALRSNFVEQDRSLQDKKRQNFQSLLDAYTKLQGSQAINADRGNKAYLQWAQNNPTSDVSKKRQTQFLNDIESYKNSAVKNARISGESEEDVSKALALLDSYAEDIQNKSYADLERLDASLLKKANLDIQGSRSYAIASAGRTKGELDKRKAEIEAKDKGFDNALAYQKYLLEKSRLDYDKAHKADTLNIREADKREERSIEDFDFQPGKLPTSDDKKKVAQAKEVLDTMLYNINSIADKVKESGVSLQSSLGSGEQLGRYYEDLALQAKEMYRLGVLNGKDYELLTKIIPNPASIKTWSKEKISEFLNPNSGSNYLNNLNLVKDKLIEAVARSARAHNYDDTPFRKKYGLPEASKPTTAAPRDAATQKYADEHFNGDYDLAAKILSQRK